MNWCGQLVKRSYAGCAEDVVEPRGFLQLCLPRKRSLGEGSAPTAPAQSSYPIERQTQIRMTRHGIWQKYLKILQINKC